MKHIVSVMVAFCVVLPVFASAATAQVPNQMQYQGYLTDDGGSPLDTAVEMVFTIYDDSIGLGTIWTETHSDVTVVDGLFEVILGSVSGVTDDVVDDSVCGPDDVRHDELALYLLEVVKTQHQRIAVLEKKVVAQLGT